MNRFRHFSSIIALTALVAMAACKKKEPDEKAKEPEAEGIVHLTQDQQQKTGVQTLLMKERPIPELLEVSGVFASDVEHTTPVMPPTSGTLKEWRVSLGDTVGKGATLGLIQSLEGGSQELTAPQSGLVLGILVNPGDRVDTVAPVLTLGSVGKLPCVLDVYEKDIGRVRRGEDVRIEVPAFPNKVFHGTVSYISPRVDEDTRSIKVRVEVDNSAGKLRFGMFVSARIVVSERQALAVPLQAVQKEADKPFVFVAKDPTTFERRWVQTGIDADGWIEIVEGLKAGETVATEGSFTLKGEMSKGALAED